MPIFEIQFSHAFIKELESLGIYHGYVLVEANTAEQAKENALKLYENKKYECRGHRHQSGTPRTACLVPGILHITGTDGTVKPRDLFREGIESATFAEMTELSLVLFSC